MGQYGAASADTWWAKVIGGRIPLGNGDGAKAQSEGLLQQFGSTTISGTTRGYGGRKDVKKIYLLA
jgi:hypothetical protein